MASAAFAGSALQAAPSILSSVGTGVSSIISALNAHKPAVAAAKAEAEKSKALSAQRIKEEETLQQQNKILHEEKMKQLEFQHKKQEAELEAKAAEDKRKHEKEMAEFKRDNEEKDKESKIKQRDDAVNTLKNQINELTNEINKFEKNLIDNEEQHNEKQAKINVLANKILGYYANTENKLDKFAVEIGLNTSREAYYRAKDEIDSVIDRTRVHESTITEFLKLMVNLVDTTKNNQENALYLNGQFKTFGDLIDSLGSGKLTLTQYFQNTPIQNYVKYLNAKDYKNMEDLELYGTGSDAKEEFDEIVSIVTKGIENEYKIYQDEKKEFEDSHNGISYDKHEPPNKFTFVHKKTLMKPCYDADKWKEENKEQEEITKTRLGDISSGMSIFFNKISTAVKQARLILSYNNDNSNKFRLTKEQQDAIEKSIILQKQELSQPIKKSITLDTDTDNNNDNDNKSAEKEKEEKLVVSTVDNKDNKDNTDENDLSSVILYDKLNKSDKDKFGESMALNKVAILSINVLSTMIDEFDQGSGFRQIAKSTAKGVEESCQQLIINMAQIRQSILLAHCILNMKPSNLDGKSLELWNVVDDGIVQIYANALTLSEVAAEFFGYLVKFEQSFLYYNETKDKSLMISTQYLRKNVKEFNKFSLKFNQHVNKLGESALTCIGNCVKNIAGAENYEKNKNDLKLRLDDFLAKQQEYDLKELELKREYQQWVEEKEKLESQCQNCIFLHESMESAKKYAQTMLKMKQESAHKLQSLVF